MQNEVFIYFLVIKIGTPGILNQLCKVVSLLTRLNVCSSQFSLWSKVATNEFTLYVQSERTVFTKAVIQYVVMKEYEYENSMPYFTAILFIIEGSSAKMA